MIFQITTLFSFLIRFIETRADLTELHQQFLHTKSSPKNSDLNFFSEY